MAEFKPIVALGLMILAVVVAIQAAAIATESNMNAAEKMEWCEDRGGEAYNANVIGDHGGLHCEFENGTVVHLSEVNTTASGSFSESE